MMVARRPARERREHRRYEYAGHVALGRPARSGAVLGTVVNLSIGGCLMKMESAANFEQNMPVEISFRSSYLAFRALGSIKRNDEDECLVGVEFINISLQGRKELRELIRDLEAAEQSLAAQETY